MGLPLTVEQRLGLSGFSSSEVYDRLNMLGFPVALRTMLLGSVWSPEEHLVGRVG